MGRCQRSSTLVPYTTLFRSRVRAARHAARSELLATGRSSALDELREQVSPGLAEMLRIPGLGAAKVRRIHESLAIEDRKSTRLNSSHTVTSYAVFCWKKKNR